VSGGEDPEIIRETLERAWSKSPEMGGNGEAAFQRANEWIPSDLAARFLRSFVIRNADAKRYLACVHF